VKRRTESEYILADSAAVKLELIVPEVRDMIAEVVVLLVDGQVVI
jgi:hypothetical protein